MFVFFFSWRRTVFVVLTWKNTVAILQSDIRRHTDFSLGTSDRFDPLIFYFLFPISFFSFPRTSCGLNIVGNASFTTFFLSFTRSSRCLWCRNAEYICVGRDRLKLLVSSPAKGAPFLSKLFLTRKIEKVEVWSRFGIVFYTVQYLKFICFAFKISASVVFLFP